MVGRSYDRERKASFVQTLASRLLLASATLLALAGVVRGEEPPAAWSFELSALNYLLPDEPDFVMPVLSADHGSLHLEARYNYEDLKTASLFAGWAFAFGGDVAFGVTPMLGGVFGRTGGVALGLELEVTWWKLEVYSENEYVFDTSDRDASFFYSWNEASIRPVEALVAGVVTERTRTYESGRDVQWGPFAGVALGKGELRCIVFNPEDDGRFVVLSLAFEF